MKILACCAAVCLACAGACIGDEIRGTITAVDAKGGTIEISGVRVNVGEAAVKGLPGRKLTLSDLAAGEKVEVDGSFSGPSEFSATKVEREDFKLDAVEGPLEKVDAGARTLSISGITVRVPASARISPENASRAIGFEKLVEGLFVECKGTWTGPRELTAERVEVE